MFSQCRFMRKSRRSYYYIPIKVVVGTWHISAKGPPLSEEFRMGSHNCNYYLYLVMEENKRCND